MLWMSGGGSPGPGPCGSAEVTGWVIVRASAWMSVARQRRTVRTGRLGPAVGQLSRLTKLTSKLTLTWRLSNVADGDDAAVALDSVLEALSNPHRREIVYVLGLQPCA